MPHKRTRAKQEEREYNYSYKPGKKHFQASGLLALLDSSADTEIASTSDNVSTPLESPADAANTDGASPLDNVTTPMQLPVESPADTECAYPPIEAPTNASNTIGGDTASAFILRSAFKNKAAPQRTARIRFDDDARETVFIKNLRLLGSDRKFKMWQPPGGEWTVCDQCGKDMPRTEGELGGCPERALFAQEVLTCLECLSASKEECHSGWNTSSASTDAAWNSCTSWSGYGSSRAAWNWRG